MPSMDVKVCHGAVVQSWSAHAPFYVLFGDDVAQPALPPRQPSVRTSIDVVPLRPVRAGAWASAGITRGIVFGIGGGVLGAVSGSLATAIGAALIDELGFDGYDVRNAVTYAAVGGPVVGGGLAMLLGVVGRKPDTNVPEGVGFVAAYSAWFACVVGRAIFQATRHAVAMAPAGAVLAGFVGASVLYCGVLAVGLRNAVAASSGHEPRLLHASILGLDDGSVGGNGYSRLDAV